MESEIPKSRGPRVEDICFTIREVRYKWEGNFGCVLSSLEKNVNIDEIRVIADVPMKAQSVIGNRFTKTKRVCWVPLHQPSAKWCREFRDYLLK